jgi:hypothetical protein
MVKIYYNKEENTLQGISIYISKCCFLILLLFCNSADIFGQQSGKKIAPPENGIYIGAFPDMGSTEDSVTFERLKAFENLTGSKPVWVYFSNNWFGKISFPKKEVQIIKNFGSIPYIRMMPRSTYLENKKDPVYTLQRFIDGKFDKELKRWAKDAKNFADPLIVEFGLEMNGDWFPWSGIHNGKNPEKFKKAYIHIIEILRNVGADNITFVYHVNYGSAPEEKWNTMSAYYPGDKYIDWIGMSIYGAQKSTDDWIDISEIFDGPYKELSEISKTKPLAIIEFGVIEHPKKPEWIKNFFNTIKSEKYSRIKAISYWHSIWENEDESISNMRLDSSPESLKAYKDEITDKFFKPKIKFQ